MRYLLIPLVLVLLLACSGCTQAPAASGPAPVPQSIPDTPAAAPQLSSGNPGAALSLDPGVIVVPFRAETAQKMIFSFSLPGNGTYGAATEFTTSGPYSGSVAFQVPAKGTYLLNITGTGRWTASTAPLVTANPLKAPVNLTGTGTQISPVFTLEKGDYIFERNSTGLSSPYYFLQFANGSLLMDANNSYAQPGLGPGSSRPFAIVTIPESGVYYLSVLGRENPGPWSVTISPVPKIVMGPGPALSWSTGTPVQNK